MSGLLGFLLVLLQVGVLHLVTSPCVLPLVVRFDVRVGVIVNVVFGLVVLFSGLVLVEVVRLVVGLGLWFFLGMVVMLLLLVNLVMRLHLFLGVMMSLVDVLLAFVESLRVTGMADTKFGQVAGRLVSFSLILRFVRVGSAFAPSFSFVVVGL